MQSQLPSHPAETITVTLSDAEYLYEIAESPLGYGRILKLNKIRYDVYMKEGYTEPSIEEINLWLELLPEEQLPEGDAKQAYRAACQDNWYHDNPYVYNVERQIVDVLTRPLRGAPPMSEIFDRLPGHIVPMLMSRFLPTSGSNGEKPLGSTPVSNNDPVSNSQASAQEKAPEPTLDSMSPTTIEIT
jgi:hypothetical protein